MNNALLYKAAFLIEKKWPWYSWHDRKGLVATDVGDGLTVEVVDAIADERRRGGYWEDYESGSSAELSTIFRVTDSDGVTGYFRKDGYSDSYGDTVWSGGFYEVTVSEKTVTTYEYVKA